MRGLSYLEFTGTLYAFYLEVVSKPEIRSGKNSGNFERAI
jgi:hypothetical protein